MAAGVNEADIQVIPSEVDAVEAGLNSCHAGDLLVVLGDNITRCWKQIVHFDDAGDKHIQEGETPSQDFPEKLYEYVEHKFELQEGSRLVQDERGVHIVVDRNEESD